MQLTLGRRNVHMVTLRCGQRRTMHALAYFCRGMRDTRHFLLSRCLIPRDRHSVHGPTIGNPTRSRETGALAVVQHNDVPVGV